MSKYRSVPVQTTKMPGGIPYIIGNEVAERFSFYGMKGILTVFMTKHLLDASGALDPFNDEQAKATYHLFTAAAYFFPLIGAIISDVILGKYRTILFLSLLYCLGHGCLAVMDFAPAMDMHMKYWMYPGLLFIAMGAGAIKPCVSAHVGDQFGEKNQHLITKIFSWFYFAINVGAATSTILTPLFLKYYGPWLAFGVPGVLMAIATFIFWLGRNKFVHIPPSGPKKFMEETFSKDGRRALLNLAPLFLIFIPMFWALFDQTGSAWVLQAEDMDRKFLGVNWLESQIQAANPILILVLIPVFTYVIYPLIDKNLFKVTPLRKIAIGMFVTTAAFALSTWIQQRIDAGALPNIGWQLLAYVILTSAEIMISITSLEFAYTQAPKRMKSFIMGIYFLGVSLGNLFVSLVNVVIQNDDGSTKLEGASYYMFFTVAMLITAVAFVFFAMIYRGRTFVQGIEDGTLPCESCGYDLRGSGGAHCPECGATVPPDVREAAAMGPDAR